MKAEACCPASCGELIQGWIGGSEKLVSCPIDWFSHVTVSFASPDNSERPMMRRMLELVLDEYDFPHTLSTQLRINWHSTIPVSKGLASSTADIASTAMATARLLEIELDELSLAKLCVALEPTDSTLFSQLTLFDHISGEFSIPCSPPPKIDILLLESACTLRTADYHKLNRRISLHAWRTTLDGAWGLLKRGCERKDPRLIGEAATLSSIANQTILTKPGFYALRNIVEKFDLYGVNVAHSGSIVGLLLDQEYHDVEKIYHALNTSHLINFYPKLHLLKMINGGVL